MKEVLLFAVGIIVGAMNAIAGGGMLLGFPILLAAGLSPLVANVTGNVVVLPGQLTSAYGYRRYLRKLPGRYLILLIPCLVGAAVGASLLRHTSNTQFGHLVPGLIFFAVLLFAFQPLLHLHLHRHIKKRSRKLGPLLLIALLLFPVAAYGGYFGPGFGFIMLAFLSFTSLRDIHQMNGLKNLAGFSIAGASIICLYSAHLINWRLGLAMAAGNAIGGYGGARLSQRFSSHAIRIAVIIIGITAATYLAFRTY
ncbi:MAG TPA: sulfite exporter TauE/SafE family protein [Verrucomicrobiae bacterium]|jgi:uncharacterized membrane protein YfcA|nr:sulfite exporter TauE/SafE family protein [Verrucomicrobiae bacterium]